jgi:hypothetical protein
MAEGKFPPAERELDVIGKLQQPQEVGNGGPVLPDPAGDLFLCEIALIDEPPVRNGDLDGVQVFALEVLDQRKLEQLLVGVDLDDIGRNLCQACITGRTYAAFPGNQLVAIEVPSHRYRLDDPLLDDGPLQIVQRDGVKISPGLEGVVPDSFQIDAGNDLRGHPVIGTGFWRGGRSTWLARDQRRKPSAEDRADFAHADLDVIGMA